MQPSAQRLSASSEFSLALPSFQGGKTIVLNAFRHHRNSHMSATICNQRGSGAQRLSASSEFSHTAPPLETTLYSCSTPFGIIGILTRLFWATTAAVPRAQRLS